jgi:predicted phosphodiesterase
LPGLIQFRKRLRDAADLQQLLREAPVDVMLYGHRHRNLATERLGARLFCTAPASVARGAFRQFDIETEATGWRVRQTLIERSAPGSFRTVETTEWQVSGRD